MAEIKPYVDDQFVFKIDLKKDTLLKNKNNYNFKLKIMKSLFDSYEKYLDHIRKKLIRIRFNTLETEENRIAELKNFERKLNDKNDIIHTILNYLTPRNAWIIEKCYLDRATRSKTTWYEEHFSKTTFYKYKKDAINQFVGYFYDSLLL
ncbi:MG284/MPN403 family protein [Mycoplasma sp. 394]|uniref:MG284/MPN403 family protein n=1 Tax=Mycoplasma sp. 6243 TaxID=3440865 RepID=UPI003EBFF9A3